MYNALDFTYILYYAGGVWIINKKNMFHLFSDREITFFSADFQGQERVCMHNTHPLLALKI
jgi:hypothetical protein